MVLQVIFLLASTVALGLGGVTETQGVLFFGVAGVAFMGTLLGLVLVRLRRVAPSAGWAVFAVPAIDTALVVALASGVAAGSCSDAELRLLGELHTGNPVAPTYVYDGPGAVCAGSFEVVGGGADVMDRYRAQLLAQGWTITADSEQPGSMGEDGSPMRTGELNAVRDLASFSLVFEEYGGSVHVIVRMHA